MPALLDLPKTSSKQQEFVDKQMEQARKRIRALDWFSAGLVPPAGEATVIQGDDFRVEVEIKGRIPAKTEPDAPRVRLWYNPDDAGTYEDRALEPIEGQRRQFGLTVPARQVRHGFHYKIL